MDLPTAVHPHLPRLSQGVTGVLCLEGLVFQDRWVVIAALALVIVARFTPQWSPVHWFFRRFARPATELEPIGPVRFSQTLAVAFLSLAAALLFAGIALAGWIVVGVVMTLALLSATTGICVGCEIYRVTLLRGGDDGDVRRGLGLQGVGPWLVVLTAPGCARCEPVARQLEELANPQAVTRVDLSRTPDAARLPVRSVPAVIAIGGDGRVRHARAGRLDAAVLRELVAAV
jgi:Domain of unknown function (DUF4395)